MNESCNDNDVKPEAKKSGASRGAGQLAERLFRPVRSRRSLNRCAGIEILSHCMRVAEGVERNGKFELTNLWESCLPTTEVSLQQIGDLVRSAVRSLDLASSRTTVVLSGDTMRAKHFDLGTMRASEVASAVDLAMRTAFSTVTEPQVMDVLPAADDSKAGCYLGVSADEKRVTTYLDALTECGVQEANCIGDFGAIEGLVSMHPEANEERPIAVLQFGQTASVISIYNKGKFADRHTLRVGFEDVVRRLREPVHLTGGNAYQLSPAEAQVFLERYPLDERSMVENTGDLEVSTDRIHALVRPLLEQLIRDVTKWIRHYQMETMLPWPRKLLLCGDGERIGGLGKFLGKYLSVPVESFDPTSMIDVRDDILQLYPREKLASYAMVIGAAMDRGDCVRLCPKQRRAQGRTRVLRRIVRYTAAAVIAWMISFVAIHRGTEADAPASVRNARSDLDALERSLAVIEIAKRLGSDRGALLERLSSLAPYEARTSLVLRDLAAALEGGVFLDRIELVLDEEGATLEAHGSVPAGERDLARRRFDELSGRMDRSPQFREPSIRVKSWEDPASPTEFEISSRVLFPPMRPDSAAPVQESP